MSAEGAERPAATIQRAVQIAEGAERAEEDFGPVLRRYLYPALLLRVRFLVPLSA
jgi:hypothetical protein